MASRIRTSVSALCAAALLGSSAVTAYAGQQETYLRIQHEVEDIRGLTLSKPLNVTIKSRQDIVDEMNKETSEAITPEEDQRITQTLAFEGFLPGDTSWATLNSSLMGEQVAGYYYPSTKSMVVVSGGDELSAMDEFTFAHETVHALQDEHFDLQKVQTLPAGSTDDNYYAVLSLIEGDAVTGQTYYLMNHRDLIGPIQEEAGSMESPLFDASPQFLQKTLLFPYSEGATCVQALMDEGGWDLVNEAYTNRPTTTEQILHPEKYLEGEGAVPVMIADPTTALGSEWHVLDENANGELVTSIFLTNGGVDEDVAADAAAGWGGDHTFVVTNGTDTAMVWSLAFDTEKDAQEFVSALVEGESTRLGGDVAHDNTDKNHLTIAGTEQTGDIQIDGRNIRYVTSTDASIIPTIVKAQESSATPVASPVASPAAAPDTAPASPPVAVTPGPARR